MSSQQDQNALPIVIGLGVVVAALAVLIFFSKELDQCQSDSNASVTTNAPVIVVTNPPVVGPIVPPSALETTSHNKEGWGQQIGMGVLGGIPNAYPPDFGPGWHYTVPQDLPTDRENRIVALMAKWDAFNRGLPNNEVRDYIHGLFPNIQTDSSIKNFGLIEKMIVTLEFIEPKLVHPEMIKTIDEAKRIFSDDAIKLYNIDMGSKPVDPLYPKPRILSEYQGVL